MGPLLEEQLANGWQFLKNNFLDAQTNEQQLQQVLEKTVAELDALRAEHQEVLDALATLEGQLAELEAKLSR